ncbi:MAG: hypothetical protein ACREPX_12665 [Rhodanobacteraceae bacterium]
MSLFGKNLLTFAKPARLTLICAALAAPCALAANPYAPAGDPLDTIFVDGFDGVQPLISNYDDLTEDFYGTTLAYEDVNYHDVNGLSGVFPDGSTFDPIDVGDQLIIENAALFYDKFPDFGSSPNTLTFGSAYVNGPSFSIGALVQVTMDLPQPMNSATLDFAFYENGPWGGIVVHLDALDGGIVVASDTYTLANGGGRDNLAASVLGVEAASFDSLHLYATFDDQPSAPRIMIDNLALTPAPALGAE